MRNLRSPFTLGLALLAGCAAPRLDVTPRWGTYDIEGDITASSSGVSAKSDLETAGLQRDDSVLGARVDLDWGPSHLSVSAQSSSHGGDGQLQTDITLGGVTISAADQVASDLDLGLYALDWTFDVAPTDLLELGLGLGLVLADLSASFRSKTTGLVAETDELAPIPVLAARLGTDVGRVELELLASGLAVDIGGDEFSFFDLELLGRLHLLGGDERLAGYLSLGYRWTDLSLEYDDGAEQVDASLTFQGPWVGLTVSI